MGIIESAVLVATGGGLILGTATIAPDSHPAWLGLWWVARLASIILVGRGVIGALAWIIRSGSRARWGIGSVRHKPRVSLEWPTTSSTADPVAIPELPTIGEPAGSAWLPDWTDMKSLRMTTADLESALVRAEEYAHGFLAPDARVEFKALHLEEEPSVRFVAWSRTAHMWTGVVVTETTVWPTGIRRSAYYKGFDPVTDERFDDWDHSANQAPWRRDPHIWELIETTWYRIRHDDPPYGGGGLVTPAYGAASPAIVYYQPREEIGSERWSGWVIYVPNVQRAYGLRDGELTETRVELGENEQSREGS